MLFALSCGHRPWMGEAFFRNSLVTSVSCACRTLQRWLRVSLSSILLPFPAELAADGGGVFLQSACDFGMPAMVLLQIMASCNLVSPTCALSCGARAVDGGGVFPQFVCGCLSYCSCAANTGYRGMVLVRMGEPSHAA